jgi:hypothetical protein
MTKLKDYIPQGIFLLFSSILLICLLIATISHLKELPGSKIKVPDIYSGKTIDLYSLEFLNISDEDKILIKNRAIYQYIASASTIFLFLLFCYVIHILFLMQNFIETYNFHKEYAGVREIGAHSWYLLIVIIILPLSLAVIPEFSTNFNQYKSELLTKVILATLANLIVIMLTAELSTLYFSLDQDIFIKNLQELTTKIFKDLRVKQLLVAIVLDIVTFYFLSRLPSLKTQINFDSHVILLLLILTFFSLISSFGAMFTLSTNEKITRIKTLEKNEEKIREQTNVA